jgi:hypothetical protein
MARSSQTVNTLVHGTLVLYDNANAPVTGQVQGNFTFLVAYNGVVNATAITLTEISSGRYDYTFTPTVVGYYHVLIRNAVYDARGMQDEFDVEA